MSFAPGQIITASRLNRLQPTTYFSQASGTTAASGSGDVAGTAISIPVQTNGATANFWWTCSNYDTGVPGGATSTSVRWDVNASPTFAVSQQQAASDKVTNANVWSTAITTAGTYTFKMTYSTATNSTLSVYTAMMVTITEVA